MLRAPAILLHQYYNVFSTSSMSVVNRFPQNPGSGGRQAGPSRARSKARIQITLQHKHQCSSMQTLLTANKRDQCIKGARCPHLSHFKSSNWAFISLQNNCNIMDKTASTASPPAYNEYCSLSTKLSLHKINDSETAVMQLSGVCPSALLTSWNLKWAPKNTVQILRGWY